MSDEIATYYFYFGVFPRRSPPQKKLDTKKGNTSHIIRDVNEQESNRMLRHSNPNPIKFIFENSFRIRSGGSKGNLQIQYELNQIGLGLNPIQNDSICTRIALHYFSFNLFASTCQCNDVHLSIILTNEHLSQIRNKRRCIFHIQQIYNVL